MGPMLGPAQGSSLGRPALPQQPAGPAAPGGGSGGARLQAPPGKGEPRWAEFLYTSLHPSGSGATSPSCRRCRAKGAQVSRDAVHFLGGIQQWSKEEPRWAQALCTTLYTSGSGARGFKLQVWPAKGVRVGVAAVQHLVKLPLYGDCIRQGHSRRDMCCNAMPHTGAARHATLATGLLDAVLCTICTQLSLHTTTLSRLCTADTSTAVFCRGQGYAHVQHALQLSQQQQGNVQQQPRWCLPCCGIYECRGHLAGNPQQHNMGRQSKITQNMYICLCLLTLCVVHHSRIHSFSLHLHKSLRPVRVPACT